MADQGVAFHCFGSKASLFLALLDQQFASPPPRDATARTEIPRHRARRHPAVAAAFGAAANGASIEALIFEHAGAATFDLILASLLSAAATST